METRDDAPRKCYVTALRMLAQRRLTEAQLWKKLERREYQDEVIRAAVERCKADGYVDDRLYAQLYVEQKIKALGDARLVGELVKKGIDRDAARRAVETSETQQHERIDAAIEKIFRVKPNANYSSSARALERLGFPASLIYQKLRAHAAQFGPFAALDLQERS
ncbi:MAG: recombination regulator RecX [Candidatus Eremiobacteraeota bacterium]|nr:recombination regulator RecX [Candidatus Eremiobacteraeota bacterium]